MGALSNLVSLFFGLNSFVTINSDTEGREDRDTVIFCGSDEPNKINNLI